MSRRPRPLIVLAATAVAAATALGAGAQSAGASPAAPVRTASAAHAAGTATPARRAVPAARSACAVNHRPGRVSCFARWRSAAQAKAAGTAAATVRASAPRALPRPTQGYGPAEIKAAYQLDQTRGAGELVAIVDAFDNPRAEQDLAVYRAVNGLPACTTKNGCFRKVNQRGGRKPPQPDAGWGVEIALDLQAVSAACPRCRLLLVEGDEPTVESLGAAVQRAVAFGARIVSNSYGADEYNGAVEDAARYYSSPGVAQVASSGDFGFTAASFPAVAPHVIAVGGTSLTRSGSRWRESAWEGAGSGCSAWFPKPAWQTDPNCSMRTLTDVSAVADPVTGFAVYDTYGLGPDNGWIVVGGTSLSSPLVAGMIGLAGNAPTLSDASYLYGHRTGLRDVIGGSNGSCGGDYLCTAVRGYDGPTGLGSPRGVSAL